MDVRVDDIFQVAAPREQVWRFFLDPQQVVECIPGALLVEVVDDRTFVGEIRLKLGPVSASFRGRVQLVAVDPEAYRVEIVAEGLERGGSRAQGALVGHLRALDDGGTEVMVEAWASIAGRLAQVGAPVARAVFRDLFRRFLGEVQRRLQAEARGLGS